MGAARFYWLTFLKNRKGSMLPLSDYEKGAAGEGADWEKKVQRRGGLGAWLAKSVQNRTNGLIPPKVNGIITTAFKHFTKAVLTGSEYIAPAPKRGLTLEERELLVGKRINFYAKAATAEGALTGAGGFMLGLADLPLWLTLKMKMLFDIAAIYGFDTSLPEERVFLLRVFILPFCSAGYRRQTFKEMYAPPVVLLDQKPGEAIDWQEYQQEYRDSIDIPKMLQLVPGIGAFVGASVNHRLTKKLGDWARNAYRKRWFRGREEWEKGFGIEKSD